MAEKGGGVPQFSIEELDRYFHSFSNVATTENEILARLVKIIATLTTSNAILTAAISELQKQLEAIGRGKKLH